MQAGAPEGAFRSCFQKCFAKRMKKILKYAVNSFFTCVSSLNLMKGSNNFQEVLRRKVWRYEKTIGH